MWSLLTLTDTAGTSFSSCLFVILIKIESNIFSRMCTWALDQLCQQQLLVFLKLTSGVRLNKFLTPEMELNVKYLCKKWENISSSTPKFFQLLLP